MTTKYAKSAFRAFLRRNYERFAELQEAQFEKGERELIEIMGDENDAQYPIPTFVLMILIWLFILLFPLILLLDPTYPLTQISFINLATYYLPLLATFLTFLVNQRYLVPKCFFRKRYALFFAGNALLLFISLLGREVFYFLVQRKAGEGIVDFFSNYCFSAGAVRGHFSVWTVLVFLIVLALICFVCILISMFSRLIIRAFILREKKRSTLEYELKFLKNQLSPHFLFNTLNNITSLIRIDPGLAETSMTKLSQLIRVMLYQTGDKYISLKEDVGILEKYAELEKLRHDDSFDFKFEYELENPDCQVEPLLMMPLMENAMKHCVNPDGKSFARIKIVQKGDELSFVGENSNFPRKAKPNASGLGLSTFKKRLELMYSGRYHYEGRVEGDVYITELKVKLKKDSV